jgi:hypothetical protein
VAIGEKLKSRLQAFTNMHTCRSGLLVKKFKNKDDISEYTVGGNLGTRQMRALIALIPKQRGETPVQKFY